MPITIITDHKPRRLRAFVELPEKVQKNFDYIDTNNDDEIHEPRFVPYRGKWYDTSQIEAFCSRSAEEFRQWDGTIYTDYFGGAVFRFGGAIGYVYVGSFRHEGV